MKANNDNNRFGEQIKYETNLLAEFKDIYTTHGETNDRQRAA